MPYSISDGVVMSAGRVFAIADPAGNFRPGSVDGLYAEDTRFLSRYVLTIEGREMRPLEARVVGQGIATYYCIATAGAMDDPRSITVVRDRWLGATMEDHISLVNHSPEPQQCRVVLELGADFADIFEVRRWKTRRTGELRTGQWSGDELYIEYERTGYRRATRLRFDPAPVVGNGTISVPVELPPHGTRSLTVVVAPESGSERKSSASRIDNTLGAAAGARATRTAAAAHVRRLGTTDDPLISVPRLESLHVSLRNAYDRALADLRMLQIEAKPGCKVLAAGMPWFMALFGRDGIISALQVKLLTPRLMVNMLETLAHYQAKAVDEYREAQPGKIPHEVRTGELSHFGEVPHSCYYGSVDATPLFLVLLHQAYLWTADLDMVRRLFPAAEAALEWIDRYGDMDGDGFVEYPGRRDAVLCNQCWKDSEDSISFADGRLAEGPIAAVEVQGYVYAAKRGMAELCRLLGKEDRAAQLEQEAERLQRNFDQAFWLEDEGYYALALDGRKQRVDSVASNPGHCLWSGIVPRHRAAAVAERLMAEDLFSGWGVRTLATGMARFHPLSYHNGSVWPHDNSLIAAGLSRYGFNDKAQEIAGGLLEAAAAIPEHRLPELFAGYPRRTASYPVPYPLANAPQAWAAGAVIHCLETLLQLRTDGDLLVSDMPLTSRSISLKGVEFRGARWEF
jgi:glycogen debranching enzyme